MTYTRDQVSMQEPNGRVKVVSLLSGGLDSSTVLGLLHSWSYDITALTFDYGQRHSKELESATKVAKYYDVKHKIMKLDLRTIGGSSLTDDIDVPDSELDTIGKEIPATYVPARNTILLSIALGLAEVVQAEKIFIGANSLDYSGYPDCRPEYFKSINKTFNLATKATVEGKEIVVETPLLYLSKAEIIKMASELDVPLGLTWSCYKGGAKSCGLCDSCKLRLKGFMEAGLEDPVEYDDFPEFYSAFLDNKY